MRIIIIFFMFLALLNEYTKVDYSNVSEESSRLYFHAIQLNVASIMYLHLEKEFPAKEKDFIDKDILKSIEAFRYNNYYSWTIDSPLKTIYLKTKNRDANKRGISQEQCHYINYMNNINGNDDANLKCMAYENSLEETINNKKSDFNSISQAEELIILFTLRGK